MSYLKVMKALLTAAVLAVSAQAQAITWGVPDGDDHPHVVVLLFIQDGDLWSCSGTLLTPTVVLTAGHCTQGPSGFPNDATWVRSAPDIDYLIETEFPNYGGDPFAWLDDTWVRGEAYAHPQYDNFAEFPNTYDVGVVVLEQPIYVGLYGALPAEGQFDWLATARGPIWKRSAVVVGYGMQGLIPAFYQDDFARYKAVASVANMGKGALIGEQQFMFTNNPGKGSGSGGSCFGDSGGPAFWIDPSTGEETNIVMAVTSWGITPCVGVDYQFRTDIEAAQDFVRQFLQ